MNAFAQIDAAAVRYMVIDSPYTFGFGGTDYRATCGARDTFKSLTEGGYHDDTEFTALLDPSQFGESTQPAEGDDLTVCLDSNGIPCLADDAEGDRINVRISKITRAGGGLTYTLKAKSRG
jgi:hypothetical protein